MSIPELDLHADPIDLTAALVDIESVSRDESRIADAQGHVDAQPNAGQPQAS